MEVYIVFMDMDDAWDNVDDQSSYSHRFIKVTASQASARKEILSLAEDFMESHQKTKEDLSMEVSDDEAVVIYWHMRIRYYYEKHAVEGES